MASPGHSVLYQCHLGLLLEHGLPLFSVSIFSSVFEDFVYHQDMFTESRETDIQSTSTVLDFVRNIKVTFCVALSWKFTVLMSLW